jgi:hypothetical protein
MRTVLLLPLAVAAAMAAGACRTDSERAEQTAFSVPARDLTLRQPEAPATEVASPVELGRSIPPPPASHRAPRARRPRPAPLAEPARIAPAPAAEARLRLVSVASTEASEAPDPHALAPGQTVTVIPVSSGSSGAPSSAPEWTDARPGEAGRGTEIHGGRHGGGCGPRGGSVGGGTRGGGFRGLR